MCNYGYPLQLKKIKHFPEIMSIGNSLTKKCKKKYRHEVMFNIIINQEYANQNNKEIPLYRPTGWQKIKIDNVKVQINWKAHALI